jgi:hypothetical protein
MQADFREFLPPFGRRDLLLAGLANTKDPVELAYKYCAVRPGIHDASHTAHGSAFRRGERQSGQHSTTNWQNEFSSFRPWAGFGENSSRVCVMNETFATSFLGGRNPVAKGSPSAEMNSIERSMS